ncbi:hypothetical protein EJ02DRAFT_114980 [Clathrospora elynae]|uniref:Uncharacterized protein n=1 Tax=Clathrospora elynae TaxID=706981 RepID=A0A6A5SWA1_9PLEO|nr:hypothetical protein EJ02DRAFT_114980 [Clathrospora elynae]
MSPYIHESSTHPRKRVRFSASASPSSSPSISTSSAFAPTSVADSSTTATDYSSGSESELSESSDEPSSDESSSDEEDDDDVDTEMEDQSAEEDGVVNLRANRGKKPVMKLGDEDLGPDIRGFLKDFLPQLKAANEELEVQRKAGTLRGLEDADEEEGAPYIEMDLGLGVLEAKDPNADSDLDSASDTESGGTERDVLGKLMGREKTMDAACIEVVDNATSA